MDDNANHHDVFEQSPPLPPAALVQSGINNAKRRASDAASPPQQRAKRNRYITIACNEVCLPVRSQ